LIKDRGILKFYAPLGGDLTAMGLFLKKINSPKLNFKYYNFLILFPIIYTGKTPTTLRYFSSFTVSSGSVGLQH
jgi:hypothetical protein